MRDVSIAFLSASTHAQEEIDVDAIKSVFPYGQLLPIEFQSGGMRASSGIALQEMGGKASRIMLVRVRAPWARAQVGCRVSLCARLRSPRLHARREDDETKLRVTESSRQRDAVCFWRHCWPHRGEMERIKPKPKGGSTPMKGFGYGSRFQDHVLTCVAAQAYMAYPIPSLRWSLGNRVVLGFLLPVFSRKRKHDSLLGILPRDSLPFLSVCLSLVLLFFHARDTPRLRLSRQQRRHDNRHQLRYRGLLRTAVYG